MTEAHVPPWAGTLPDVPKTQPRFPIYIPSYGRAKIAFTPVWLERMGVDYHLVVEPHQYDDYAEEWGEHRLLELDMAYKVPGEKFDPLMDLAEGQPTGSVPARNFIWDHAVASGAAWHWIMDDNIKRFVRRHQNQRIAFGDGSFFHIAEDFALRYRNLAMCGPDYLMFAPSREGGAPFVLNTRIFSCNLIRNDVPFRWRGRYNEDIDLSLRMLKAGWNTVLFKALLQEKLNTQKLPGGNTDTIYDAGTLEKSEMIARSHPDCCRVVTRYGRHHHDCDLSRFRRRRLLRWDDVTVDPGKWADLDRAQTPWDTTLVGTTDKTRRRPGQ